MSAHAAARLRGVAACLWAAGAIASAAGACGRSSQGQGSTPDGSAAGSSSGSSSGALADVWVDDSSGGESSGDASGSTPDGGSDADAGAGDDDVAPAVDATDEGGGASDASADDASEGGDVTGDGSIVVADASCRVEIDRPPLLPGTHVPIGTSIQWNSNPPSSGPHYPIWAAFQAYTAPVPRGYYVHDLEHGAVVLLYNCGDGGCPDVVAALQAASDAIPDDPLCASDGQGVRVRTVITPDPLLDVPVAAAAWGWVYRADCADLPTLRDFALQHYGQGPEMLCSNGTTQF